MIGCWRLPNELASAGRARAAVRGFLAEQHVATPQVDAAVLVVNELVTNALVHARAGGGIVLQVAVDGAGLHVEVEDGDPVPPLARPEPGSELRLGGRGLEIVEQVCARWGWAPAGHDRLSGKRVWCDLGPFS